MLLKLYIHNVLHGSAIGLRLTPRTVLNLVRWYPTWRKSLTGGTINPLHEQQPWLTLPAVEVLASFIKPHWTVFEWGSGGSTLFFLNRAKRVVSIEHNREWHARVAAITGDSRPDRLDSRLIPPDDSSPPGPPSIEDPEAFGSHAPSVRSRTFKAYASAIDEFEDEAFDLILIDGRARPSCFVHAMRHIRPGGLVVWDDTFRSHYLPTMGRAPSGWTRADHPGPIRHERYFGRTSVWTT